MPDLNSIDITNTLVFSLLEDFCKDFNLSFLDDTDLRGIQCVCILTHKDEHESEISPFEVAARGVVNIVTERPISNPIIYNIGELRNVDNHQNDLLKI